MTTGIWSVGSITEHVGALVGWDNIPVTISGTVFNTIVEQEINFAELITSDTIDSLAIQEKYQPGIIDLSYSKMLFTIDTNEGGADDIKLGDLSIKAGDSSSSKLAKQIRLNAIESLDKLKQRIRFKRIIGA